jgi:hypothetical protein
LLEQEEAKNKKKLEKYKIKMAELKSKLKE